LQAVILFGIPNEKDEQASGAYAEDGVVQKRFVRSRPNVPGTRHYGCLPANTSHGHWWRHPDRRRPFPRSE
jgi:porphobilinogen synthase